MPIVQQGAINTTALVVPDLYVQIVPPQTLVLNGVPTNTVGVVGTSSWGPLGVPVVIGSMAQYAAAFGPVMARKYDMGTQIATAVQQGASDFRCVRVSDRSDTAAIGGFGPLGDPALSLTAINTGTLGDNLVATLSIGSAANSLRCAISLPGLAPEVFDNISNASSAGFWSALAAAINTGAGALRGPSALVAASVGPNMTLSATAGMSSAFSGGTDGAIPGANVSAATLLGVDTLPRTGLYALRGQGCSIGVLADADESTAWSAIDDFGVQEGIYMIQTGPMGDSITNAVATKRAAGLDSPWSKLMFGDWVWWNDAVNATLRLVSPQGFVAGRLATLSPEQSSLNKPLYCVVGTQQSGSPLSGQASGYSTAELAALLQAGIDVISNPQPGGAFWGVRGGHNSSSDAGRNGDNYTRLTDYLAATLQAGMGGYVGQVINGDLFRRIRATLLSFLQGMLGQGLLGSTDGSQPFSVICDTSNNPQIRTQLGYVQADVQVQYQAINEKFIVNVEGGQTVSVQLQTLPTGQPA